MSCGLVGEWHRLRKLLPRPTSAINVGRTQFERDWSIMPTL
jgi:hypothetical protein